MALREVQSLEADVTIAIGKRDKSTGKPYPTSAEGYYLGNRKVQNKRGESTLHFLQTPKGNLGVWGTTDLDRKLRQTPPGSRVVITSNGTRPTPNGDMYVYKVQVDDADSIDVSGLSEGSNEANDNYEENESEDEGEGFANGTNEGGFNSAGSAIASAAAQEARRLEVQAMLNKNRSKSK